MEIVPSSKKNSKNELLSFFTKHDFSSTTFTKVVTYRMDYISGKATFSKNVRFIWPFLKNANEEQINEIKIEIEDLKKTYKIFEEFELRTKFTAGDTFVPIPEVSKLLGNDEKFTIEHDSGQILLVFMWDNLW